MCFAWERGHGGAGPSCLRGAGSCLHGLLSAASKPKSQIPEHSLEQGTCPGCHILPGKIMVKKSQPDSKGNSAGLLCGVENAARFSLSCRMKGILPNKWQEIFPAWPPTGLRPPKGWFDHSYPKNRHGSHGRRLTHPRVTDPWKSRGV